MTKQIERATSARGSRGHVAVVDDDPMLLDLMGEVLVDGGWTATTISDASSGLPAALSEKPDVIILDIRLRGAESGWRVLHDLKVHPLTRATPIIVWSGDARLLEDRRDWLEQHGIRSLRKPFAIDELFGLLDTAVDEKDRGEASRAAIPV
jgi:DNA-binding response OmpR family regulator